MVDPMAGLGKPGVGSMIDLWYTLGLTYDSPMIDPMDRPYDRPMIDLMIDVS